MHLEDASRLGLVLIWTLPLQLVMLPPSSVRNMEYIPLIMQNTKKDHLWEGSLHLNGFVNDSLVSFRSDHCIQKLNNLRGTKNKFSIKNFFSKCDQTCMKLRIWSYFLKKSLMEKFIFCAMLWTTSQNVVHVIQIRSELTHQMERITKRILGMHILLVFSKINNK